MHLCVLSGECLDVICELLDYETIIFLVHLPLLPHCLPLFLECGNQLVEFALLHDFVSNFLILFVTSLAHVFVVTVHLYELMLNPCHFLVVLLSNKLHLLYLLPLQIELLH